MDLSISMLLFLLGLISGWLSNYWFAVVMKQPKLAQTSSGQGRSSFDINYKQARLGIRNELRIIGIGIPNTSIMILGKFIKTHFGSQIVKRDPALKCSAHLYDSDGKRVCQLFWEAKDKVVNNIDIESDNSANLLTFIRKVDDEKSFTIYQPTSSDNFKPKLTNVPEFSKSTQFKVKINYSFNKVLEFSTGIESRLPAGFPHSPTLNQ